MMNKKQIYILSTMLLMIVAVFGASESSAAPAAPLTARQIIDRSAAKLRTSGGINASFTMSTGGRTLKGSLKSSGNKFALTTPSVSSWYNGKSMWTYNAGSKETTVINPTPAELTETNPLLLVSSGPSQFTAAFAKKSVAGSYEIILTPKSRSTGMKSIHVSISTTTLLPVRIVAVPISGSPVTVDISSLKTGVSFPASVFEYSKSSCRNATIVDLR